MRHRTFILSVAALLASAAAPVRASPPSEARVHGQVVAVTGTEVYVDFGAAAGVRVGDALFLAIGSEEVTFDIVDVAPRSARAALPAGVLPPRVGDAASAIARPVAAPTLTADEPEPPDTPENIAARWRGVDLGRPRRVAFGGDAKPAGAAVAGTPAMRGDIAVDYLGIYDLRGIADEREPLGPTYHRVQVRSSLDVAPPSMDWLDYSHRLRLRLDFEPGAPLRFPGSRDALLVYRLRAGLTSSVLHAELGRTNAAPIPGASLVDGASVRYRVASGAYLGGFGGASPHLLDLAPALDGYRFGVYTSLRRALGHDADRWRLSADLGFVGTTFDGAIDRRALGVRAAASTSRAWVSARALLDFYPADHPAARPSVELSTGTANASVRWGDCVRVSAGFDHYRTERTREALAVLPADYLEATGFSSARGHLSVELARGLALDLRSGYRWQAADADSFWFGGGMHKSALVLRDDRLWFGGDGYFGRYQDGGSGYVGYAFPIHPRLDIDARYRLAGYRYGEENQHLWRHWVQLGADAWLRRRLTLQVEADAHFGDEDRVLTTFASMRYRL